MRLLLVDDHPLFGIGFAHALTYARSNVVVQTALTLDQGLVLAADGTGLDAVLIDYRLGGDDGLDGLRRFGDRYPVLARVLISSHEDAALAARAKAAGASAFIGKSLGIDAVFAVLDCVCSGGEHFDLPGLGALDAMHGGSPPTARQLEVLALLAQGQQNKRIALELGIAERTVKLHVTALLESLGAHNRTHLLVRARELGLV